MTENKNEDFQEALSEEELQALGDLEKEVLSKAERSTSDADDWGSADEEPVKSEKKKTEGKKAMDPLEERRKELEKEREAAKRRLEEIEETLAEIEEEAYEARIEAVAKKLAAEIAASGLPYEDVAIFMVKGGSGWGGWPSKATGSREIKEAQAIRNVGVTLNPFVITGSAAAVSARATGSAKTPPPPPKYQNPANPAETWSGRGRAPEWARKAREAGTLEDCLIKP